MSWRYPLSTTIYRIVAYGSRSLTNVETRYSQTEREALAVLWALKHFHYYIFDNHVTIITDHKTLVVFYIITSATYRTLVNEDASLQLHYAVCNWITKCCRCAVEKPEYSPNQRHGNTQLREHGHHLCGTITCQSERHCKRNKQRSNTNK